MKLREFINTCGFIWDTLNIYNTQEEWDEMVPSLTITSIKDALRSEKEIRDAVKFALNEYIDQWEVDKNFAIHVLVSP